MTQDSSRDATPGKTALSQSGGGRYRIEVEAKDLDILRLRAFLHDQFGARVLRLVRTDAAAKHGRDLEEADDDEAAYRHRRSLSEAVFDLLGDGQAHRMRDMNAALGRDCSYAIKKMLREAAVFRAGRGRYMRSDFRRPKPSDPNYRAELEADKRRILDLLDRPMTERELRDILRTSSQDLAHKLRVLQEEEAIERLPVTDRDSPFLYLKRSRPLPAARKQSDRR